jgi:hypothetical protein
MFPVDAFRATISRFADILSQHGIRFHLTGGVTSAIWGEPRMTQDIDIVVDNEALATQLDPFLNMLSKSVFMFDEESIRSAVRRRKLFQLLDTQASLKLDVYPRELIPGELNRSELTEIFEGLSLPIASRSDAAASKLVWISKGSHKSRRDLRRIYSSAGETDRQRIGQLAAELHLSNLLTEVLAEPDEIID